MDKQQQNIETGPGDAEPPSSAPRRRGPMENLLWVRHFQTIEELRQALLEFRETYNATWLIERHGFMSPADFRQQRQLRPVAEAA